MQTTPGPVLASLLVCLLSCFEQPRAVEAMGRAPLEQLRMLAEGPILVGKLPSPRGHTSGEVPPLILLHLNFCYGTCHPYSPPSPIRKGHRPQRPDRPKPSFTGDRKEAQRCWVTCLWPWAAGQESRLLLLVDDLSPKGHGSKCPKCPLISQTHPSLLRSSV